MYEAALYSFNYKLWKVARSSSKIDYVKQDMLQLESYYSINK